MGIARRVNSPLTLSVQTPVNRLLSAAAERLHTEPWKHRGMDQLCPKPHTMADKGCTEAGDQLSFAQVAGKMFWQLHGKQLLSDHRQSPNIYQFINPVSFNILES